MGGGAQQWDGGGAGGGGPRGAVWATECKVSQSKEVEEPGEPTRVGANGSPLPAPPQAHGCACASAQREGGVG